MTKTVPFPFQTEDVRTVWKDFGGRALLAHSMGLGKSLMALLGASKYMDPGHVVVVCPATVKEHWKREAKKHLGMRATVLSGRTPTLDPAKYRPRIWVVNYDILGVPSAPDDDDPTPSWCDFLKALEPKLLIIDEAHYIRNHRAQRTKAVREISRWVGHCLALTGTALVNRPAELWPILNVVRPDLYPSFWHFAFAHCDPKRTRWGWDFGGAKNLDKLHARLVRTCMVRRRKEDVLTDLPPKTRTVIPVPLTPAGRKEYDLAVKEFLRWLATTKRVARNDLKVRRAMKAETLVRMGYLKRLAGELKADAVRQWVDDFLESSGEKLVLFGVHKAVLHPLAKHYGKRAVLVDGGVVGRDRQAAIDRFNSDPDCRVFVGNVQAAGVGWSCTSASAVAFCELSWVPGEHAQAEDRVLGIGRGTGRPVSCYYLVADETIESDLVSLLERKMKVIATALDGSPDTDFNLAGELERALTGARKKTGKNG